MQAQLLFVTGVVSLLLSYGVACSAAAGVAGAASLSSSSRSFHFVLVHGAGHGGWCWYKVSERLQRAGHRVDAIDLRSSGINDAKPATVQSLEDYSEPLARLLASLPADDKVVLVGHSFGGASLTYAIENFHEKILGAVYVAGLMLPSGPEALTLNYQLLGRLQGRLSTLQEDSSEGTHELIPAFDPSIVKDLLYNLSPPEDVVLAKALLKPFPVVDPTVNFTRENYGRVSRYYIKTSHDNVVAAEDQDLLIRITPPSGVWEMKSDHAPFFSQPDILVYYLQLITKKLSN